MRIEALRLSWFRGASAEATLEPRRKSLACFGPNGAGKSTFVDALEYLASDGKVDHLSHEYAGKGQINGVRNTHAPATSNARIEVVFGRDDGIIATISAKGVVEIAPRSEASAGALASWRSAQLILRQDEVSRFINSTKGDKYSALLPLLGLAELETVADNVRKLTREVEKQGRVVELEVQAGGAADVDELEKARETVRRLATEHGVERRAGESLSAMIARISTTTETLVTSVEETSLHRQAVADLRDLTVVAKVDAAREAASLVRESWNELVLGKARVTALEGAGGVLDASPSKDPVACPSCGRSIASGKLRAHVAKELEALALVRHRGQVWEAAAEALSAAVESVRALAVRVRPGTEVAEACDDLTETGSRWPRFGTQPPDFALLADLVERAKSFDSAVAAELSLPAPTAPDLFADRDALQTANAVLDRRGAARRLEDVLHVSSALDSLENVIRQALRVEAERTLDEISAEVQRLWSRLHPGEPIEDVKLYAGEADKALDVSLRYYGRDQPSPRLTLSEGHRNSLGLCIFLALVRLRSPVERPIILDDIISSLDREHRGRVIDLLSADFADRQILLFTHDHEWFAELRAMLPGDAWIFGKLLPWDKPEVGLRWSGSAGRFDEARKLLSEGHYEAAGNRARAAMDEQLAIAAEKLEIRIPFRRGERNDHRTWHDFLPRLIALGQRSLKISAVAGTETPPSPIEIWKRAEGLLTTIGNRASHGGSIAKGDAEALIEACEQAVEALRCLSCKTNLWTARTATQSQCKCGLLAWKLE